MATALLFMLDSGNTFRENLQEDARSSKSDSEESFESIEFSNNESQFEGNQDSISKLSERSFELKENSVEYDPESQETLKTFNKDLSLELDTFDHSEQASLRPFSSLPETLIRKTSISDTNEDQSNCQLKPISPNHLGYLLNLKENDSLILDCRSFMKFNQNHINGALNACCTNNTIKKRFVNNKIEVVDLVSGPENKDFFKETLLRKGVLLVVYDDDTVDIQSSNNSCIKLISDKLKSYEVDLRFLSGGMKEFFKSQSHHCTHPTAPDHDQILLSPTSPYVNAAINTTTMTQILPFLYLGNEKDASNVDNLLEQGITHLLNVSATIPLYCQETSIQTKRLPSSDNSRQNIKQYFPQAIEFIEEARKTGGKVLVHCQAGVSRSPTITMAYLMARFKWDSYTTFDFIKEKRSIVAPNINFMGQLLEFETHRHDYNLEE